jgi:transmembrane sensor
MSKEAKSEAQLEAEAAEWFTTMHSGDVDSKTRERFEAWLHGDRAHKVAYREFEQVYRDLDFVAEKAGVDIDASLGRKNSVWGSLIPEWLRNPVAGGGAVLASVVAAALVVVTLMPTQSVAPSVVEPDYVTQIAEIRELTLEDGSVVTLGAKSKIQTEFTATRRQVTLLDGEAFFEVAKDPNRPFFVAAQDTLVRVVGTKFDVKRSADIVHVSVLEGVVEVMKPNNIEETVSSADTSDIDKQVLTAGERVSAARRVALPQARQVEQVEPGSWRQGRLAYEDASLAEIVADLNRYYERPVRIASSDVGDLRSTLAFQTTEIDQVFDVMAAIHPIEVEKPSSGEIVLRRRR